VQEGNLGLLGNAPGPCASGNCLAGPGATGNDYSLGELVVTGHPPESARILPPVPSLKLTPPKPKRWAFGFSGDFTFHLWWGGSVGWNLEKTDLGLGLYFYHPLPVPGSMEGFSSGGSFQFNLARGSGDWTGPFYNVGGNLGPVGAAGFSSDPFTMSPGTGWSGISVGGSVGAPAGAYTNQTLYHKLFLLPLPF
jgi:hypothetical protein